LKKRNFLKRKKIFEKNLFDIQENSRFDEETRFFQPYHHFSSAYV
jgi:hypothetical protein